MFSCFVAMVKSVEVFMDPSNGKKIRLIALLHDKKSWVASLVAFDENAERIRCYIRTDFVSFFILSKFFAL